MAMAPTSLAHSNSTTQPSSSSLDSSAPLPLSLLFVTSNRGKLAEVLHLFHPVPAWLHLHSMAVDVPEIQAATAIDIAIAKARAAYAQIQCPLMVEDTGLGLMALHGLPGPYIKWFMEKIGATGLYTMTECWSDQRAEAVCTVVVCRGMGEHDVRVFQGTCTGKIVRPRENTATTATHAFGWDPCFQPDGESRTFAEMDGNTKNGMSHRGRAMRQVREFIMREPEFIRGDAHKCKHDHDHVDDQDQNHKHSMHNTHTREK